MKYDVYLTGIILHYNWNFYFCSHLSSRRQMRWKSCLYAYFLYISLMWTGDFFRFCSILKFHEISLHFDKIFQLSNSIYQPPLTFPPTANILYVSCSYWIGLLDVVYSNCYGATSRVQINLSCKIDNFFFKLSASVALQPVKYKNFWYYLNSFFLKPISFQIVHIVRLFKIKQAPIILRLSIAVHFVSILLVLKIVELLYFQFFSLFIFNLSENIVKIGCFKLTAQHAAIFKRIPVVLTPNYTKSPLFKANNRLCLFLFLLFYFNFSHLLLQHFIILL